MPFAICLCGSDGRFRTLWQLSEQYRGNVTRGEESPHLVLPILLSLSLYFSKSTSFVYHCLSGFIFYLFEIAISHSIKMSSQLTIFLASPFIQGYYNRYQVFGYRLCQLSTYVAITPQFLELWFSYNTMGLTHKSRIWNVN